MSAVDLRGAPRLASQRAPQPARAARIDRAEISGHAGRDERPNPKRTPLDLAILPPSSPSPITWIAGTPDPGINPGRKLANLARTAAVPAFPYFQPTSRIHPADDIVRQVKRKEQDREWRRDGSGSVPRRRRSCSFSGSLDHLRKRVPAPGSRSCESSSSRIDCVRTATTQAGLRR